LQHLAKALTKGQHLEVKFVETTYSAMLTEPLKTYGILGYTAPARIEKRIIEPYEESFIADGDKVFIASKGKNNTLSLADHPELRAFVEAFRSLLSGEVTSLQRHFEISLMGGPKRWTVTALPRDPAMRERVRSIQFAGQENRISEIEILATDGDRSVMRIEEQR
jgi:hypothetical protein